MESKLMNHTRLAVILGTMLLTANPYADTRPDEQKASDTRETAADKNGPSTKQRTRKPAKPAKPATTFRPSEKISADSAVSFPVDI